MKDSSVKCDSIFIWEEEITNRLGRIVHSIPAMSVLLFVSEEQSQEGVQGIQGCITSATV